MLKKIWNAIKTWWKSNPTDKYVDAGILDFSGQGRNKYGR